MATRNSWRALPLIGNLVFLFIGYSIYTPSLFAICTDKHVGCLFGNDAARTIGEPLIIYSLAVLPITFLYIWIARVRNILLKFSAFWIPISVVLIALTPS